MDIGAVERYFGEIHGILFRDDNDNGVFEFSELPLAAAMVYLDLNGNGAFDANEPVDETDADGNYTFLSVPPGDHLVSPVPQPGWERTLQEPRPRIEKSSYGWEVVKGNHWSMDAVISADARFIAFWSNASNLVPNDTNGTADVFVYDRQNRTTRRVSVASDGTEARKR